LVSITIKDGAEASCAATIAAAATVTPPQAATHCHCLPCCYPPPQTCHHHPPWMARAAAASSSSKDNDDCDRNPVVNNENDDHNNGKAPPLHINTEYAQECNACKCAKELTKHHPDKGAGNDVKASNLSDSNKSKDKETSTYCSLRTAATAMRG